MHTRKILSAEMYFGLGGAWLKCEALSLILYIAKEAIGRKGGREEGREDGRKEGRKEGIW
jgi:predicted transposase YdaD